MKKKLVKTTVILFLIAISYKSEAQNSDFQDYKSLATHYLNSVLKGDTIGFKKISSPQLWVSIIDCGKKEGDTTVLAMETLIRNDYDGFFSMTYMKSFAFLKNEFKANNLSSFKVDSVKIESDLHNSSPCKSMPMNFATIFFSANNSTYKTKVGIVEFKKAWYVIDATYPKLYKL